MSSFACSLHLLTSAVISPDEKFCSTKLQQWLYVFITSAKKIQKLKF
jgi:hypothetical protein